MDKIAVLDFGGQYAHLIANRIRRLGVYSEILDGDTAARNLVEYKGLILSGGPASVNAKNSILCDKAMFDLGIPILGICYGHQLIAFSLGGLVQKGKVREYGSAKAHFLVDRSIFKGVKSDENVWMSHFDQVIKLPEGFEVVAQTSDCKIAAMANYKRNIFSTQFHLEVTHSPCGQMVLENFVILTGAKRNWNIDSYIEIITEEIKQKVGDKKVFLMISGGVDSTVAFLLLRRALGQERVYGLFVDMGFMRLNEREEVTKALKKVGVENLHVYDASEEAFKALKEVYDPEQKRKIIGNLFLDIQEKVSEGLELNSKEWFLGQGTIYPDTIETGGTKHADTIKTHHNQVQRIKDLDEAGKVIEPIKQLYKDEVRIVGRKLGLPQHLVWRHPFPGPGLAVRCLCIENEDRLVDCEALEKEIASELADLLKGAKVRILPIKSVGVQGDERTYKHPAVVYGKPFSWDDLNILSTRLTNQFPDVNRVLYGLRPNTFGSLTIQKSYLTKERILLLQQADKIVMDFIEEAKIDREIWQFPTVLIPLVVNNPAVAGGCEMESIVLRPVESEEAMTANFYHMDFEKLDELVKRLSVLEDILGIFYDITNKPPGTIEWE